MKLPPFSPRKMLMVMMATMIGFAVVGWSVWFLAAAQYRRVIDGWIEQGRASGYDIGFDDRQMFGFPHHITMRLVNLHWKNTARIDFHADAMDIAVIPWDWQHYTVKFKGHVAVTALVDEDGHALTLAAGAGQGQVALDHDGQWLSARLALENTKVGFVPHYLFGANMITMSVERPIRIPKDHSEVGLILEGEADDIALPDAFPAPFGKGAEKFAAHMRVMGRVPDVRERTSMESWNRESGVVEFDHFALHWGDLNLTAKGTMGFDDDLQPEGAFAATVADAGTVMRRLVDTGFIAIHNKDILDAAMTMFSQPQPNGAGMPVPITVQLGGLFMGPIRVFEFPPLEWPTTVE